MPKYPIFHILFWVGLTYFGFSQGLEDKVSENYMLKIREEALATDSLEQLKMGLKKKVKTVDTSVSTTDVLDSLIQGPVASEKKTPADTAFMRYEMRIFSKSPGSLFGSTAGAVGKSHVLGSGDKLVVALWGDKESQYHLSVNPQGKIFLEGVGLVDVAGLSVAEAEEKLRNKLSKIYSGIQRKTTFVEISQVNAGPAKVFVLGEVMEPGGYIFSGNTSIFSALYQARGPTSIGSVRKIKLTRGSKTHWIDLYEYLLRGNTLPINDLQDGDIVFLPRAEVLVSVKGDVGRPAIYELKIEEGIKDLLTFAGELNPTAATHRISLKRIDEKGKLIHLDLPSPQEFIAGKSQFNLKNGDSLFVEQSSEDKSNFITVSGPVKYPGDYDVHDAKDVSKLVEKAGGLMEEAYLGRVHVLRFRSDGSSELQAFSLENTALSDITLRGKDHVILYSLKDMFSPDSVEIRGAVFKPGMYLFNQGMSLKDLVLRAGGYLPNHESGKALCFRNHGGAREVEYKVVALDTGLQTGEEFLLKPRDLIHIPIDPRWYEKEVITLAGEFLYPGKYSLLYPGEKIVSVLKRAGMMKKDAYIPGFRFFRSNNRVGRIAIDLKKVLKNPASNQNISLQDGDSLYVPELQLSVKVVGEVGFPSSVLFKKGASVNYYVDRAGGLTRLSDKKRIILEYANGETTSDFYRDPDPGSVIFVSSRPEPKPVDWFAGFNLILGTLGAVAALTLSILAINGALK